jgi:hypothetical protein
MKMDVETLEDEIIAGAVTFISVVDVLYILMEWSAHKEDGQAIIDMLNEHNMHPLHPNTMLQLDLAEFGSSWPSNVLWQKR